MIARYTSRTVGVPSDRDMEALDVAGKHAVRIGEYRLIVLEPFGITDLSSLDVPFSELVKVAENLRIPRQPK